MWKKTLTILALGIGVSAGNAWSNPNSGTVDVNLASISELMKVKGIGPSLAERIVRERSEFGNFHSLDDFSSRIKGMGKKRATKLSQEGLWIVAHDSVPQENHFSEVSSVKGHNAQVIPSSAKTSTKKAEKNRAVNHQVAYPILIKPRNHLSH